MRTLSARELVGEDLGVGGEAGARDRGGREHGARFEGPGGRDVDDGARFPRLHDGGDQSRHAYDIHEIDVEAGLPVLVGQVQDRLARPMAGAVDDRVDAAPFFHRRVDEALQVVVGAVRAGDADAAELLGQRLALAGGREDGDPKPSSASLRAASAPMPLPPAVMIATLSSAIALLPVWFAAVIDRIVSPGKGAPPDVGLAHHVEGRRWDAPLTGGVRLRETSPRQRRGGLRAARKETSDEPVGISAAGRLDGDLPHRRDGGQAVGAGADAGQAAVDARALFGRQSDHAAAGARIRHGVGLQPLGRDPAGGGQRDRARLVRRAPQRAAVGRRGAGDPGRRADHVRAGDRRAVGVFPLRAFVR